MAIELYLDALEELRDHCNVRDGKCYGCIFASDRDNDYECRIKAITGTYPDTWKGMKP